MCAEHVNEYHDAMISMLELIWGDGFMAPGGAGNVGNMVQHLDLPDRLILDIGCGIGGPACVLAKDYGARVIGIDLEAPLVERARRRAQSLGLSDSVKFQAVKAGPLQFSDDTFDVVFSSGAFTQIENKVEVFQDCLRVLKPGGVLTCYDWMRTEAEYSEAMLHWFEVEGLTYAMATLEQHGEFLKEAGFEDIELHDASDWYRAEVEREFDRIRGPLYRKMVELMGAEQADHFVENWRAMVAVCRSGEMRQGYYRGRKPD